MTAVIVLPVKNVRLLNVLHRPLPQQVRFQQVPDTVHYHSCIICVSVEATPKLPVLQKSAPLRHYPNHSMRLNVRDWTAETRALCIHVPQSFLDKVGTAGSGKLCSCL